MGVGIREGQQDRIGLRGELAQAQYAAEASMPRANARSRTLMARLQARRFRQIYEYLAQVKSRVFATRLDRDDIANENAHAPAWNVPWSSRCYTACRSPLPSKEVPGRGICDLFCSRDVIAAEC